MSSGLSSHHSSMRPMLELSRGKGRLLPWEPNGPMVAASLYSLMAPSGLPNLASGASSGV